MQLIQKTVIELKTIKEVKYCVHFKEVCKTER